jgi:hypothetical protein
VADDLVTRLARVSHFAHLPEAELCAIVGRGQTRRVPGETVLFEEGQPSAGCPSCWNVACPCESSAPLDGRQPSLEPAIMFNEGAALEQGANPVTVTAARSAEGAGPTAGAGQAQPGPPRAPGGCVLPLRGGSMDAYGMDLRIRVRSNATPTCCSPGFGFRCARDVK